MSLASGTSLKPRPLFAGVTQSITNLTASTTPVLQSFQPTYANGVITQVANTPATITQASITQLSIAEWNALTLQNFYLKGINTGTSLLPEPAVVYELLSFGGGNAVTPSTLQYFATSVTGVGTPTPSVVIVADV
jgi:hypothetical protein